MSSTAARRSCPTSWMRLEPLKINTFLPVRLNKVSSMATVIAVPGGTSRFTISTARVSPTPSLDQRAWAKKRCARE